MSHGSLRSRALEEPTRPVAFVTGASRGIGRAIALELAAAGFDVAVAARTLIDGHGHLDDDPTVNVPGGLDTTVEGVTARGARGFAVAMDLVDPRSIAGAAAAVLEEFGSIDVLVNNAVFQGAGVTSRFDGLDATTLETILAANFHAPVALIRALLPALLTRPRPTIVNLVSATAVEAPPAPVGEGGWSLGYAASKAALARVAPILHVEYRDRGLRVFSVDPGFVVTEKMTATGSVAQYARHFTPATPDLIGRAVAWLVVSSDADELAGTTVIAQREVRRRGL